MADYRVFQPHYLKKFSCTGSGCKDHCCQSWTINVDQKTYEKYLALDDLRDDVRNKIEVKSESPFQAKIRLDESGVCPFLNERGLCSIQLRFGHDYLGDVCQKYPRLYFDVAGETEAFLSMSCEAAVKTALFRTELMKFEEVILRCDEPPHYTGILDAGKYTKAENGVDLFWKLRTTSLLIVQSRQYKLWLRLVILGLFIKQADEFLTDGREDEIPALTVTFGKRMETGFYDTLGEQMPDRYDLKIGVLLSILNGVELWRGSSLLSCVERAREGLGITGDKPDKQLLADRFIAANQAYFLPFFEGREHILENYVVNLILLNGFPFQYDGEGSVLKSYVNIAVKYGIVKFLLIGMSGYHRRDFDKRRVIEGIAAFSRMFDHNSMLAKRVIEYLEENNAATVGTLSMLMKD